MLRDTLVGSGHSDVTSFWAGLAGELSGPTFTLGNEAFRYNYIPIAAPITCVATEVASAELSDAPSLLSGLRQFRDKALKSGRTDAN